MTVIVVITHILAATTNVVWGQSTTIGIDLCACTPTTYTFQLNFTALCNDTNIVAGSSSGSNNRSSTGEGNSGIIDVACFVTEQTEEAEPVDDVIPVAVSTIDVLELNEDLDVLEQTQYADDFRNGDTFTYTSVMGMRSDFANLSAKEIPAGLQLNIVGRNQIDQPIVNLWAMLFSNECGIYPVLVPGDAIGWTILVSVLCE